MSAYAGQTVLLRFRYKTDEYTYLKGILIDEIVLDTFTDGAEAGDNGWALNGFKATTGVRISVGAPKRHLNKVSFWLIRP